MDRNFFITLAPASSGSAMAKQVNHDPKFEGFNSPAGGTGGKKHRILSSWDHIHNTSVSSELMTWPIKLECYFSQG